VNRLLTSTLHFHRMRGLLTSLAFVIFCVAVTPALATGGAYRTIATQTAASCARACADDGLCIAWTLTEGSCALSAITPRVWPQGAAEIGFSSRAPAFASLPERPVPLTSALTETATPQAEDPPQDDLEYALLGGRVDGDLRPRLGGRN
jgi:hypothetical protein